MNVLVVQNYDNTGLGQIARALDEAGAQVELIAAHRGDALPVGHSGHDALVVLGGAFGVAAPKVAEIDARLHGERRASGGAQTPLSRADLANLPDGTMISHNGRAYALRCHKILPWSFGGYAPPVAPASLDKSPIALLTPATAMEVLRAGYRPAWHPSADVLSA